MKIEIKKILYRFLQDGISSDEAAQQVLDLFDTKPNKRSEPIFCGYCGQEKSFIVSTDVNSGRICKNRLCKKFNI